MKQPFFLILCFFATFEATIGCTQKKDTTRPNKLIIEMNKRSGNALVCLAEKRNNLRNTERKWQIISIAQSEQSLVDLMNKKIDVAIATPPSFFRFSIAHPNTAGTLKILAGINSIQNNFSIISSRKSNIQTARDLKYKRLGHMGEPTDFFKNYFFLTEGINESQITQSSFATSEKLLKALDEGKIDAAIVPDEISDHLDHKRYLPFFSSIHEITSQVIVRDDFLKSDPDSLTNFLETLISVEKELYIDLNLSLERMKTCYPESRDEGLNEMLRRRELRVLIDESLRTQYVIYKKWLMSKPELRSSLPLIREFRFQKQLDSSLLKNIDYRRVLIK